jgi:HAMP domain-containing protein
VTGAQALWLVAAIAATALLAGRLFLGGFGAELFRRFDPAGAAASLVVGTAELTLLSVSLSGVGFPTRDVLPLVGALQLAPLALAWRRRRLQALRPRGRALEWATLLVPAVLAAGLGLLPVLRASGFSFGNDTYTYCAFSEWLQQHAFSETCRSDPQSPVTAIPALWQSERYDLGIAHWLALVQAAVRPATVLTVYPSTSAFGLVLLVAAVWLAARQLLRLDAAWAGAAALLAAAVPHGLYWGHHNGFLQQGYALPVLVFGLVLLARVSARASWRPGTAALLALPFAFLVSVYLPLLPAFGFAGSVAAAAAVLRARRSGRTRRLLAFVGFVAVGIALFAARDVLGALSPLHGFATHVAGGHVPMSAAEFLQFAIGTFVPAPGWVNVEVAPWSALNRALTPLYLALVLVGLWYAARRPRTRPLAAAAGLLLLGAAYFALAVKDPWSGLRGHTWNLLKLAQWGWPLALLLAVLGARRLAPRRPPWRFAALALAVLLPASQVSTHGPWSRTLGQAMREILPGTTLERLPALKQRVHDLPPGILLVVGRPVNAHRWLGTALALLAYPRAIVADWTDGASVSNHPTGGDELYARLVEHWRDPRVVAVVAGYVPFQPGGVEPLGGGLARLTVHDEPLLVHVVNPSGLTTSAGAPSFDIGKGRTKLVIFAPAAARAELALTLAPYAGRPGKRLLVFQSAEDYSHRAVRLASEGTAVAAAALGGETSLLIPLELGAGLGTVILLVDEGRGVLDAREPVTVVALRLTAAGGAASLER